MRRPSNVDRRRSERLYLDTAVRVFRMTISDNVATSQVKDGRRRRTQHITHENEDIRWPREIKSQQNNATRTPCLQTTRTSTEQKSMALFSRIDCRNILIIVYYDDILHFHLGTYLHTR